MPIFFAGFAKTQVIISSRKWLERNFFNIRIVFSKDLLAFVLACWILLFKLQREKGSNTELSENVHTYSFKTFLLIQLQSQLE